MGSRDESDAFAPRVTFVRAPRRWQQNAGRGSTGAASGEGEAIGASDAGAAAAVPERRPSVDGRKTVDELEAWMRRTNLRRAPEAHYLDVETLRHLFVADRAAHAGEPADAERVPPNVFGSLFGIACSKAFGAPRLARRRGLIGVTCDARAVRTVEGFDDDPVMNVIRRNFSASHALQCGYCTPGMLITAYDLANRLPDADRDRIRLELSGNLCRCTGYLGIINAIEAALADLREGKNA